MTKRHSGIAGQLIAWGVVFVALALGFSSLPIPGWFLAVVVILAIPCGLAGRYPRVMPRWFSSI